jgi:hypothetical protein
MYPHVLLQRVGNRRATPRLSKDESDNKQIDLEFSVPYLLKHNDMQVDVSTRIPSRTHMKQGEPERAKPPNKFQIILVFEDVLW